jgi:hypothetical protein
VDIKTYDSSTVFVYTKDIDFQGRKYLAIVNYHSDESTCSIDLCDLELRQIETVLKYKVRSKKPYKFKLHNAIEGVADTLYICAEDTLYSMTDYRDRSTWAKYVLPDNGRILRTRKKFGNVFYVRYVDDNNSDYTPYWMTLGEPEPKPQAEIVASDKDFGEIDIWLTEFPENTLSVSNPSQTAELIITARSQLHSPVFTTDLPLMTPDDPLIIPAGGSYDYELNFAPSEVKEYRDSIIFYSNAMGSDSTARFSGSGIDTTTSIEELEKVSYLYAYPPYPMPAKQLVSSLIYFDNEILAEEVEVFDRFGVKVGDAEDISIDKVKSYSAILSWNCSGVPTGVYFIRVRNGGTIKVLKVIVKK